MVTASGPGYLQEEDAHYSILGNEVGEAQQSKVGKFRQLATMYDIGS